MVYELFVQPVDYSGIVLVFFKSHTMRETCMEITMEHLPEKETIYFNPFTEPKATMISEGNYVSNSCNDH